MENTYILKVTVIRPVANRDSHAAPYVFWDLGRSYFILVLKIKLSYSNMQSQNLLRFFIPVLSLTPEDFFFPFQNIFCQKLSLFLLIQCSGNTKNKLFPLSYKAFFKGQISHCHQSSSA